MMATVSAASLKPVQVRILLSGTIMFLFFGLFLALPDICYNKDIFPGGWHVYTLHVEATQNGMMLWITALLLPFVDIGSLALLILEISVNLGAWFNVFPWIYAARTSAIFKMSEHHRSASPSHLTPPENNEQLVGNIGMMLMVCAIGDLLAYSIVLFGLSKTFLASGSKKKKTK